MLQKSYKQVYQKECLLKNRISRVRDLKAHRETSGSLCAFFLIDWSEVSSPNLITGECMLPVYINRNAAIGSKKEQEVEQWFYI